MANKRNWNPPAEETEDSIRLLRKTFFLMIEYYSKLFGVSTSELLSKLFGVRTLGYTRLSKNERTRLRMEAEKAAVFGKSFTQDAERINSATNLNDAEKFAQYSALMRRFADFLGISTRRPAIDEIIQAWEYSCQRLEELEFDCYAYYSRTRFKEYCSLVKTIIKQVVHTYVPNKTYLIRFLDEALNNEDMRILLSSSIHAEEYYRYLDKPLIQMKRKNLQRLVQTYQFLSGILEKEIRIVAGLLAMVRREKPSYRQIAKKTLGQNVESLARAPTPFGPLVSHFKTSIRNAIAHGQYRPDYGKREIKFTDREKCVILQYDDFVREVQDLSSLVDALWLIYPIRFTTHLMMLKDTMQALSNALSCQ